MDGQLEVLLAGSGSLQRLARRLAADVHEAEDLVQDAWVAALERERRALDTPAHGRAWLERVLTNRWRSNWRSRAARVARERRVTERAAGEGAGPSPAELLERLEIEERLVQAVRALREPYRTAIVMRYFEELSPERVAARTSTPLRTVHSRLHRGLALLRRELAGAHGRERSDWLGALASFASSGGTASRAGGVGTVGSTGIQAGTGIVLMKAKIAGVAGVLLALGGVLWTQWPRAERVVSVAPLAGDVEAVAPDHLALGERAVVPAGAQRGEPAVFAAEDSPSALVADAVLTNEPAAPLRGRVLTVDGAPVAGVRVVYAPFGSDPAPGTAVTSDSEGWFEVAQPLSSGQIDAAGPDWATVLQPRILDLAQARREPPVLVVAPAHDLAGHVRSEDGRAVAEARFTLEVPSPRPGLDAIVDESHQIEWEVETDENGAFELKGAPLVTAARIRTSAPGFADDRRPAPEASDVWLDVVLRATGPAPAFLVGRVVDEAGSAIEDAWVALGPASSKTDAEGRFRLNLALADDVRMLRAIAQGWLPAQIEARPGELTPRSFGPSVELVLRERPGSLSVRVLDAAGEPVAGVVIGTPDTAEFAELPLFGQDFTWSTSVEQMACGVPFGLDTDTDSAGRCVLRGLQPRPYVVTAFDPRTGRFAQSAPTLPNDGGDELLLRFSRAPHLRRAAGRVEGLDGAPLAGVDVEFEGSVHVIPAHRAPYDEPKVWQTESDEDGRWFLDLVPETAARVSVHGGEAAEEHSEELDPRDDWESLVFRLPALCHLQVDASGLPQAAHFSVVDAEGERVPLRIKEGWMESATYERGFAGGRSGTLRLTQRGTELVVFDASGAEILRQPLALDPGEPSVIVL